MAVQLVRDVLPKLNKAGVKLFAVGIGSAESALTFAERTGFPASQLLTDESEETDAYVALGTRNTQRDEKGKMVFEGVGSMWSERTNDAIKTRGRDDLNGVVGSLFKPGIYTPLMPKGPKAMDRTFVQGGTFIFDGSKSLFEHYDFSSGDHADLEEVVQVATAGPF
mmetsp:Transcript_99985/g.173478  ORF Transcript_99985/g.173478 Transcript_99985/m.173478 type:complete len:166 (-) Transcript_99985:67-564(-)